MIANPCQQQIFQKKTQSLLVPGCIIFLDICEPFPMYNLKMMKCTSYSELTGQSEKICLMMEKVGFSFSFVIRKVLS